MSGRIHFANNTLEDLEANVQKLLLLSPALSAVLSTRIAAHHLAHPSPPLYDVGLLPTLPMEALPALLQISFILTMLLEARFQCTHLAEEETEAWVKA